MLMISKDVERLTGKINSDHSDYVYVHKMIIDAFEDSMENF